MGHLGSGDNRTPYSKAEYGDKDVVGAIESERRRAIASRGRAESALAVVGAGMALLVAAAIVFNLIKAIL